MATDQRNLPAYFSSNADFQAWVAGIHAQLSAVGLVNTADTGQINPATVLAPGAWNTIQGYEIWRFNDALQSTAPVFLKIEYGSQSNFSSSGQFAPGLAFTVGTGTNGAGTLTGLVGVRRVVGFGTLRTAGLTLPSYCCSDGSGLVLVNGYDASSLSCVLAWVMDRTRDGAGTATGDGIYTFADYTASSQVYLQVIPVAGTVPGGYTANNGAGWSLSPTTWFNNSAAPAVVGSNVPVMPTMYMCGKTYFAKMMHTVQASQVTQGVSISASILGGTHTLMPLVMNSPPTVVTGDMACMLWE
jgi:hypothetical protein